MKKKTGTILIFMDISGTELFRGRITEIPVPDTIVKKKSLEFFNDPEPCFIHRNAVLARLYEEIEKWIDSFDAANEISVSFSEIPADIRNYLLFDAVSDVASIIVV